MDWQRIARAHTHPLRLEILAAMSKPPPDDRGWSPIALAELIPGDGSPAARLGRVAYHVRQLSALGLVELGGTRQRRGAIEHFYRVS